jgi:2OG-Fe(II) oxygenase superfamily
VAKDIIIGSNAQPRAKDALYRLIQDQISQSLFQGKYVNIELYKLAVYGKDGHFDWHRDTTHGDDHHATVLVALNTKWKGGNFGLKYQETTVDVDLHVMQVAAEELVEDGEEEEEEEEANKGRKGEESGESGDKRSTTKFDFQIVAFYTDIEHKVEKITDGTRIVLQFDANVEGDWEDEGGLGVSKSLDTLKSLSCVRNK